MTTPVVTQANTHTASHAKPPAMTFTTASPPSRKNLPPPKASDRGGPGYVLNLHKHSMPSVSSSSLSSHSSPLLAPQTPPPSLKNLRPLSPEYRGQASQQAAIEAAYQTERARMKKMEASEVDCTAEELRRILRQERQRMTKQAGDIARLKQAAVQCQVEAEISEEGRINGLMRHMDSIQSEKSKILAELEREEDLLARTLRKLEEVRREKKQLQRLITHEESHQSNLQTKLDDLKSNAVSGGGGDGNDNDNDNERKASDEPSLLSAMESLNENEGEEEESEGGDQMNLPDLAGIQS